MIRGGTLLTALLLGSASGGPEAESSGRARTHTVEIRNFGFSPARLELAVGDTVVWVNRDAAPHTATEAAGLWDSEELEAGARWSRVVVEAGRVAYLCAYHPSMRGELIVRAPAPSADRPMHRRGAPPGGAPLDDPEPKET